MLIENRGKLVLPDKPDHIGYAVRDARKTADLLSSMWGLEPCPMFKVSLGKDNMILGKPWSVNLVFLNLGQLTLEICEPVEGDSFLHRFLESCGEGINHIGFNVSNWDDSVDLFKRYGNKMIMAGIFEGKRWCYFRTLSGNVVVEFMDNYGIHGYEAQV